MQFTASREQDTPLYLLKDLFAPKQTANAVTVAKPKKTLAPREGTKKTFAPKNGNRYGQRMAVGSISSPTRTPEGSGCRKKLNVFRASFFQKSYKKDTKMSKSLSNSIISIQHQQHFKFPIFRQRALRSPDPRAHVSIFLNRCVHSLPRLCSGKTKISNFKDDFHFLLDFDKNMLQNRNICIKIVNFLQKFALGSGL